MKSANYRQCLNRNPIYVQFVDNTKVRKPPEEKVSLSFDYDRFDDYYFVKQEMISVFGYVD